GPDALTERALSMLNAAAPQKPQTSGTDALTDRALWMLSASPDDLKQMAASIQAPERPSLGTRALAGANTGLIAQTLGMPVDLATNALNLGSRAINTAGQASVITPRYRISKIRSAARSRSMRCWARSG